MQHEPAAERYAEVLFETALEHGVLDEVAQDLADFTGILESSDQLRLFLRSFRVTASDKVRVFRDVFSGKMCDYALNTIALMLQNGRSEVIPDVRELYTELVKEHRNIVSVQTYTAVSMDEKIREQVKASLEQHLSKDVDMVEHVDESLQGGIRLRIKNTVYDGTVAHQLEKLRERLR